MRGSTVLCISAILAALFIMASNAFAACSSCGGEADWSRSADEFMNWDPTGEEPAAFGINPAANQPVNQAALPAQKEMAARETVVEADEAGNYSRIISLQSINATIATVKSGGTTLITAVFAVNQSERLSLGETQLSVQALIKDSAGAEAERLILIRSSANRYFSNWVADVPPGSYRVDILASSPEEEARFRDALEIEVVG
ncbi:MAG TPA: hypothetical protein PLW21_08340 [Methanothrix sp.]|nr:hypothetical protein [Methanothrix sp.]HUM81026.1 hypothetical protein [Methanothrix sp.]